MGIVKMDIKRCFWGWRFLAMVLAVAVIWYLNSRRFAMDEDVLGIFFDTTGRSTVLYLSLILCNGAYGLSICEELQDYGLSQILSRVRVKKYCLSKLVVCIVSNIVVYCTGTFCYLLYELTQHPLVVEEGYALQDIKNVTTFSWMLPEHTLLFIFLQCLMSGICCSCMSVLAVALSAYIRDGFIILCLPSIFFFLLLFASGSILKLPVDTEQMFQIITADTKEGIFFLRIAVFTVVCYLLSAVLLYLGISRRKRYA